MLRIYLDLSCLNRIFDDQSFPRIYMESSAMLVIFGLIEEDKVEIVDSDVIEFENSQNPYQERKNFVDKILDKATIHQNLNLSILKSAQLIEEMGISGLDALHLASGEALKIDFLITCDDDILKKYKGKIEAVNPVEFVNKFFKE